MNDPDFVPHAPCDVCKKMLGEEEYVAGNGFCRDCNTSFKCQNETIYVLRAMTDAQRRAYFSSLYDEFCFLCGADLGATLGRLSDHKCPRVAPKGHPQNRS